MLERSNMCMGIMDSQISIYVTGIVVYKYIVYVLLLALLNSSSSPL